MTDVEVSNRLPPDASCRELVEAAVRQALGGRPGGPWRVKISDSSSLGRVAIDIHGKNGFVCMSVEGTETRDEMAAHICLLVGS